MSRIDDALKRSDRGGGHPIAEIPPQRLFGPAWPIAEHDQVPPAAPGHDAPRGTGSMLGPVAVPTSYGVISFSSAWQERLAGGAQGDPTLIEQFRRLAATLHHAHQNGLRSVMVTSASPGDGKTLTAVNLALTLAESYRYKVLLIDADLRRPSIPAVVELGEGSGLSEALRAPTEQKLALVPLTSRLTLLPAGQAISNSIEALTSPRMRLILEEAAARFDWVILDAPPVGPTADARLLTQMVGGTLFVIHAGQTEYPAVLKAIDALGRAQILGVVLNGVKGSPDEGYYGVDRGPGQS